MKLNKSWIVGFTDGDGHFGCWFSKKNSGIRFNFSINQHKRDIQLLYALKTFFSCGRISKEYYTDNGNDLRSNGPYVRYEISNRKHLLEKIIPFFNENPLNTKKYNSFEIWSDLINKTENGLHLTEQRKNMIELKEKMNSHVLPKKSQDVTISDEWLVGFIDAEGMFSIRKDKPYTLIFGSCQYYTEIDLMCRIRDHINCGYLVKDRNVYVHKVTDQKSLANIIIPFFETNKLRTSKRFNFLKFRKIALLKEKKEHLTTIGQKKINKILMKKRNKEEDIVQP